MSKYWNLCTDRKCWTVTYPPAKLSTVLTIGAWNWLLRFNVRKTVWFVSNNVNLSITLFQLTARLSNDLWSWFLKKSTGTHFGLKSSKWTFLDDVKSSQWIFIRSQFQMATLLSLFLESRLNLSKLNKLKSTSVNILQCFPCHSCWSRFLKSLTFEIVCNFDNQISSNYRIRLQI